MYLYIFFFIIYLCKNILKLNFINYFSISLIVHCFRIKVQAQRKFAQNAATPNSTPQKPIQIPVVSNNVTKPPIKRPNTEDFLTFLCFRGNSFFLCVCASISYWLFYLGTSLLPPRLDFFNKPQRSLSVQEISAGKVFINILIVYTL